MPIFPFFRWPRRRRPTSEPQQSEKPVATKESAIVRRHFYNEKACQTYASFFPLWNGWATAGHVLTDTAHIWPAFTGHGKNKGQEVHIWPEGLDAALTGCELPATQPDKPSIGQKVKILGYPAGSRHLETRTARVYLERGAGSGTWIAHILAPDEPVVTGMSGGPVIDIKTGMPIGIVITRNSPADLNADRDPDESCDFVALSAVWEAVQKQRLMA